MVSKVGDGILKEKMSLGQGGRLSFGEGMSGRTGEVIADGEVAEVLFKEWKTWSSWYEWGRKDGEGAVSGSGKRWVDSGEDGLGWLPRDTRGFRGCAYMDSIGL